MATVEPPGAQGDLELSLRQRALPRVFAIVALTAYSASGQTRRGPLSRGVLGFLNLTEAFVSKGLPTCPWAPPGVAVVPAFDPRTRDLILRCKHPGHCVYELAHIQSVFLAGFVVIGAALICLGLTAVGWQLGQKVPALTALLIESMPAAVCLAIGAAIGGLLIGGSVVLIRATGAEPTPRVHAVSDTLGALLVLGLPGSANSASRPRRGTSPGGTSATDTRRRSLSNRARLVCN